MLIFVLHKNKLNMKALNVRVKQKINTSDYVHLETGEVMDSKLPKAVSINIIDPPSKVVDSKEYVIVDSQALDYIATKFTPSDMGRIMVMTNMVQGRYNLLCVTNKSPYTDKTLPIRIDLSVNKYRNFMDRLLRAGVVSYIISYIDNVKCKFIILNPYIARKSKTFDVECLEIFSRFLVDSDLIDK